MHPFYLTDFCQLSVDQFPAGDFQFPCLKTAPGFFLVVAMWKACAQRAVNCWQLKNINVESPLSRALLLLLYTAHTDTHNSTAHVRDCTHIAVYPEDAVTRATASSEPWRRRLLRPYCCFCIHSMIHRATYERARCKALTAGESHQPYQGLITHLSAGRSLGWCVCVFGSSQVLQQNAVQSPSNNQNNFRQESKRKSRAGFSEPKIGNNFRLHKKIWFFSLNR